MSKHTKVNIWIDKRGYITASTDATDERVKDRIMKGFTNVTSFNVPRRYITANHGWKKAYTYFVIWATHDGGI